MFEIDDVDILQFEITYGNTTPTAWHKGLKSIERCRFLSGNVMSEIVLGKDTPALMLTGDEFGIFVFYDRIQIVLHSVNKQSGAPTPRKKPLSRSTLRSMTADFNMVVGIVLGTLGVDIGNTTFKIDIELKKDKTAYQDRSIEKVISQSIQPLLEESTKIESAPVKFITNETFLERPARAVYDLDSASSLDEHADRVVFFGQMRFTNTGIQDLEDVTVKYIHRINQVIDKLVKGMKSVE